MWIDKRRQQHRVYWRKPGGGRDYEPFPTEAEAEAFMALCKRFGREKVVTRRRAQVDATPTSAVAALTAAAVAALVEPAPVSAAGPAAAVPALAAGLTAPTPVGITLRWLAEQYVSTGTRANEMSRADYRRDLDRYVHPYFGEIDIAMVMTRALPTRDGADWPWPTVAGWHQWLAEQPKHDRHGKPVPDTLLSEKTRRNIESLLSQIFNFALAYDQQPLLGRNPCTPLGLTRPDPEECVWLERSAAELLLSSLDPHFVVLVRFLLATGLRWGEAAALQVKDVHLGDGTELDPPWVYVHKTWKRTGRRGPEADGKRRRAKYVWGRGRTKTAASRRRITLTQGTAADLRPLVAERDPQAPVFTMTGGGVLHNSNFTQRFLVPALERARQALARRQAAATPAERAMLPVEIPEIRPHAFRHTHAAWLLSAGRSELEVQRRLGHADAATTKKVYGHLSREASLDTMRFLEEHLAPLMVIGYDAVVTAAEDSRIDRVDELDAALPLVEVEEEDDLAA